MRRPWSWLAKVLLAVAFCGAVMAPGASYAAWAGGGGGGGWHGGGGWGGGWRGGCCWGGGGGVFFGFAPPIYLAPPVYVGPPVVYAPPPVYAPGPAYAPGPGYAPGAIGQSCAAGAYICPLEHQGPVGAPCTCPANTGRVAGQIQ